jgi:hypothetical protein
MEERKIMCAVLTNFTSVVYEDIGVAWKRPMSTDVGPGRKKGEFVASFTPVLRFSKNDTCPPFNPATVIANYEVDGMIAKLYIEQTERIFSQIIQPENSGIITPTASDIANIGGK